MMVGEIQEPFNLSLLENSIYKGSVSFGRFEKESLSWERRSSFSHNRYLEEAERFSKPGSVTQMRAHFEAHFKKKGIRFPSNSLEAQTWGQVVHHDHHHPTCTEKDENLLENTSQFSDSCLSYDDDHDHQLTSLSITLEKNETGKDEIALEDKNELKSSPATLKNVKKANLNSTATKAFTKKQVVTTKGSSSCNNKISIDTKRQKELKPKMVVKTIASQALKSKKTESLTPLATIKNSSKNCIGSVSREKRTPTNGIISREKRTPTNGIMSLKTSVRAEKKKEEKVEAVVPKARPMPKSTQARSQHMSIGQVKARDNAQEHSSKATYDRSFANGTAKGKVNGIKQKVDTKRSTNLNRIRPKTSDQTARNSTNRRSLAVRRSGVEVAL